MDQDLAAELFERGAAMIYENVSEGTHFGLDSSDWIVGPKFMGVKMIPPGPHFAYFSVMSKKDKQQSCAPRVGYWMWLNERDVVIRKWNEKGEDFETFSARDDGDAASTSLKDMDPNLAPYPYESYKMWFSLTNMITEELLRRVCPADGSGRISSQVDLVTAEAMQAAANGKPTTSRVDRDNPVRTRIRDRQGLPIMTVKAGAEIRFCKRSLEKYSAGALRSRNPFACYDDRPEDILGELQFCFVCFFYGQVYCAFEEWRSIIVSLSIYTAGPEKHSEIYEKLIAVLFYQCKIVPADFFVDIVSQRNFLTVSLGRLFQLIANSETLPDAIRSKASRFKEFITSKFEWNFDAASDEGEDYEPIVVETIETVQNNGEIDGIEIGEMEVG